MNANPGDQHPRTDAWQTSQDDNPIQAALSTEARHMPSLAVRINQGGALTDTQRGQIRRAIAVHTKKHGLSYKALARQINASPSTISEVVNDKYKGNSDDILRKLNAWIDDDAGRRDKSKPLGFYETNIFKAIRSAAKFAKRHAVTGDINQLQAERARIVMAYGPSGCGKTLGARAICADDPNAIYVRIRTGRGNLHGILNLIVESCQWRGRPFHQKQLEFVFDKLRGSGRLLIVDEAHKLVEKGYELLRDLTDECGIPILLLGTSEIQDRVHRIRAGVGKGRDDQFCRRVGYTVDLLKGTDGRGGDKRPIFSLDEVVAIFHDADVRLTPDGAEFLCVLANTIGLGSLGMASNIYQNALMAARQRNRPINRKLLLDATQSVLLPQGHAFEGTVAKQIASTEKSLHEMPGNRRAVAG